jgi:ABC-2 type transport system ATP-binding protein
MAGVTLEARALTKRFGERVALRDVSFQLAAGEVLAVIGPNGAGKTTLLSLLAGVATPSAGEIIAPSGRRIGWVPQKTAVYSKLSVLENLRLFARLERVPDTDATVALMLEQTGLTERADDQLGRLSGGNRQRVNIAIGLLAQPAVVLLDEPSASLDPRQRERLWQFITPRVEAGTSILFATHDIAEADRHAGRILVLADGELLYSGTPGRLHEEAGGAGGDLETAFVNFLRERGH